MKVASLVVVKILVILVDILKSTTVIILVIVDALQVVIVVVAREVVFVVVMVVVTGNTALHVFSSQRKKLSRLCLFLSAATHYTNDCFRRGEIYSPHTRLPRNDYMETCFKCVCCGRSNTPKYSGLEIKVI